MKVKELIKALRRCDPNAEIHLECYSDNGPEEVAEYRLMDGDNTIVVYIGDNLFGIDDTFSEEYTKTTILG